MRYQRYRYKEGPGLRLWIFTIDARAIAIALILTGFVIDRYTNHAIWHWLQYWTPK